MLGRPSGRPFFVSEMPYKIIKRGAEFCVVKKPNGDTLGCHALRTEAEAQIAAIYANEEKELSMDEEIVYKESLIDQIADALKWMIHPFKKKDTNEFMVWKDDDTWKWLAIYSNKFRDDDKPPEILSEAAHKEYVKAVDDGEWDYPELWLWHVPGTKIGKAQWLGYDDNGFVLAAGIMEDEQAAQALLGKENLLVSHGMLGAEMQRDEEDPSIITRYRTVEISPLPNYAAANRLTGFITVGGNMSLPKEKRDWLIETFGEERVEELEASIGEIAKETADLESKESEVPEEETKEEEVPEVNYVTHEEVVESVGSVFGELNSKLDALIAKFDTVEAEVKALKEAEEERDSMTPAASLTDMIKNRAVGNEGARIDGRTKEAKEGPQLPPGFSVDGPTPIPFLNQFMAQGR